MHDRTAAACFTWVLALLPMLARGDGTSPGTAPPEVPAVTFDFEADQGVVMSNTLQRYNNSSTTRFDATDFTGHALSSGRLTVIAPVGAPASGHELRLEIVPLQVSGTQIPRTPIVYDGETFSAGQPLRVLYQFNTYRLTYAVPVLKSRAPLGWDLRVGATVALRDAQVRLQQDGLRRNFANLGPVPLAFGSARVPVASHWTIEADVEGFPAPGGGGLLDTSLRLTWSPASNCGVYAGVRYLAGGATGDTFFNFLHVRTAMIGLRAAIPR